MATADKSISSFGKGMSRRLAVTVSLAQLSGAVLRIRKVMVC
jgi:hypothetical protein